MSLEILHLSLENSPNSFFLDELFENFPNAFLEKHLRFFSFDLLSLENSPTSEKKSFEVGEFSKLILFFEKKTFFRDFVSFESEFSVCIF